MRILKFFFLGTPFVLAILLLISTTVPGTTFKEQQLRYPRVRQAYTDTEAQVRQMLADKGIALSRAQVYLRGFKYDKELEVWAKNPEDAQYQLVTTYDICQTSGTSGPKRKQGDYQIPEGFYHINAFNPSSNFYLSLKVNYPNRSDAILGDTDQLGGDIFVHGNCVTIGCIPITDKHIKALYVLCVEARNAGQMQIPITLFPARPGGAAYGFLIEDGAPQHLGLWEDLAKGYAYFEKHHTLPNVTFLANGRHRIE